MPRCDRTGAGNAPPKTHCGVVFDMVQLNNITPNAQLAKNPILADAVPFLEALLAGVPDNQYLEIRTMGKAGGAQKKFYLIGDLRSRGMDTALPRYLDGRQHVYYGAAPRYEKREAKDDDDHGDAVNLVAAVWFDEITIETPPDLPIFSWMVQTSLGKVQGGYLLSEPTADLERVEWLNQRLGAAVGGDNVWAIGRILRLPGFINIKYEGNQRSHLIEFHPERRYTLEELERLLPPLSDREPRRSGHTSTRTGQSGKYDPHRGSRLAEADQKSLAQFLSSHGLELGHDNRFRGSCPFHDCECERAFYCSAFTGSWHCFCTHHEGTIYGDVGDLANVGFIPQQAREVSSLSWKEIEQALAHDPTQEFYRPGGQQGPGDGDADVRKIDINNNGVSIFRTSTTSPIKQKQRTAYKPSALWDWALENFPKPIGVKPLLNSHFAQNKEKTETLVFDCFATTWFNLPCERHKRRSLLFNLVKRFARGDTFFRTIAADDFDDHIHEALRKSIKRKGGSYFAIDNCLSFGYWICFSTVQVSGFEPVDDLPEAILKAVKGITVPEHPPAGSKFRPTRSSQGFGRVEDDPDEDKDKLDIIASKKGGTDWNLLEANLREMRRNCSIRSRKSYAAK
jgi:hypothetical protein